ncbi:MAG: D-glycerate dehydrogenase [Stygiobacter sp. RIFOXYC12_FULL_38_8]|nr:MAG: D-glycerate dehydrogenase [Stygiobacter sp. GWC2_38_9]OGU82283.1 MAG: D-glycerate dehydrogenase [Stygiobacter sp. RIFOXYA12_FULL_38_9]OGV06697.1 MAG: D-glycerate dehydrogenase [Stygiobacter sp. RIFOXYB2_FULL_37_11]OGV10348.1 MAG: D-glycerate dehydrogenase [Stygiobacter sp. RIFOXYA2_FULL_38_8]OGV15080.1 MAG: D-glycerate dehydrogenase [Stygiobacter sp. RIFOXYC2_FULL_38_25]OGV23915.1 MAG: D-glycerate dehydrogenase [Stygiobacter sp. RIFOXYC12_FULL_38_8]OGV79655.1 MAG: D-glycerate dehydrog
MKVLITRKLPGEPEKLLKKNGFKVSVYKEDKAIPRGEFLEKIKDADAVLSLLTEKIDKEAIDNFSKCKIVANCAVGYNNIDIAYAKERKLIVTNTPYVLTDATADLTVALILACVRRLREGEQMMRENKFDGWKPNMLLGFDLKGKTVGIIGAGRIGRATARRLKGFGVKIIYFDRKKRDEFETEFLSTRVNLKELMKQSDIISVHLPLSKETHHIINKENLSLMKKSAIIVNTSRGDILEEKALIRLLKQKKIFAAGFDVYENEPNINPDLRTLENVFLLPHIGSATVETRAAMALLAANNIINVLNGKEPITPV